MLAMVRPRRWATCIAVSFLGFATCSWANGDATSPHRCGDADVVLTPTQVVDAQFSAYNSRDLDGFAACYADDVSMVDLSGKNPAINGQAELRKAFAYLAKPGKGGGVRVVVRVVNGPIVVDREHPLSAQSDKPLPDLIAVYEVRGGKIVNVWFPPTH
jgi:hypothetical protein